VPVGSVSATESVAIKNVGETTTVPTVDWESYPFVFTHSTDCTHIKLASGASCHMFFQFVPAGPGETGGYHRGDLECPGVQSGCGRRRLHAGVIAEPDMYTLGMLAEFRSDLEAAAERLGLLK
jgi:hypothetical protein